MVERGRQVYKIFLQNGTPIGVVIPLRCFTQMIVFSSHSEIQDHIVQLYEALLHKSADQRPTLDGFVFYFLDSFSTSWLERLFEENKVYQVVYGMVTDNAPSPDGFSMPFFQACWDIEKVDIMKVFQEFFSFHKFEKSFNATFITLIPQIFEPIS